MGESNILFREGRPREASKGRSQFHKDIPWKLIVLFQSETWFGLPHQSEPKVFIRTLHASAYNRTKQQSFGKFDMESICISTMVVEAFLGTSLLGWKRRETGVEVNHILICLLTLLCSLSGPAMGGYSDFWQSSNAARAADELVTVRIYTNTARREGISSRRHLRADTWLTLPSEIPSRAGHLQIERLLEIQPGRGSHFLELQVPASNLRVPANGPQTSGGSLQFQPNDPVSIDPSTFRRPPGRPGG